jgi:hypothetical protein
VKADLGDVSRCDRMSQHHDFGSQIQHIFTHIILGVASVVFQPRFQHARAEQVHPTCLARPAKAFPALSDALLQDYDERNSMAEGHHPTIYPCCQVGVLGEIRVLELSIATTFLADHFGAF